MEHRADHIAQDILDLILEHGGEHDPCHKQWLIDQVVRNLSPDYERWVQLYNEGEDGPDTYRWDAGIAP